MYQFGGMRSVPGAAVKVEAPGEVWLTAQKYFIVSTLGSPWLPREAKDSWGRVAVPKANRPRGPKKKLSLIHI